HYTDLLKANFESEPVELWLPALLYFSAAAEALDGRSTARRSLNDAIEISVADLEALVDRGKEIMDLGVPSFLLKDIR
ncbi:hypothetical protein, partial [Rhizobium johnstonii]|uniref:hypothetical protein n=1 Tax=Rhizobium johnstonii TaxID=3019933 RepID=UPI003F9D9748